MSKLVIIAILIALEVPSVILLLFVLPKDIRESKQIEV